MSLSDDSIVSDALKIQQEQARQAIRIEEEKTRQLQAKMRSVAERRNYIVGSLALILTAVLLTLLGWAVYGATQHDRVIRERMEQQCVAAHKNWHGDNLSCE